MMEFLTENKNTMIKKLNKFEKPLGFKRELTDDEQKIMRNNFKNYSWTNFVDERGFIILGNGIDEGGYFYINEDDLLNF
jgi:hypothetical protein